MNQTLTLNVSALYGKITFFFIDLHFDKKLFDLAYNAYSLSWNMWMILISSVYVIVHSIKSNSKWIAIFFFFLSKNNQ